MQISTLDILRCPYCSGRLELVTSLFHRSSVDDIDEGILGCHCCIFPVVDGIPILHLQPQATAARDQVQAARPDLALRTMIGLDDESQAARFEQLARSDTATYQDIVEALGPTFEGGYFLYRFSDPTYVVAQAVVRAVASTVLRGRRRAIDVCGGSGHLTRTLLDLSTPAPVVADLYFAKIWLARRFTAPGCEGVCCDGNAPFPFARGAFGFAMCSDAFMYIWTKRQFVAEMARLIDRTDEPGAVLISHTHNELAWSPSHGQPLSPKGYRDLFESLEPHVFGEAALLQDVLRGGPLDLTRRESTETLNDDPALTIIASRHADVFAPHPIEAPALRGEYRLSPLYAVEEEGDHLRLFLQFPSEDYAQEYSACREYLPDQAVIAKADLTALAAGRPAPDVLDLIRRRVILDLPKRYY